jgi:hypothetical protein
MLVKSPNIAEWLDMAVVVVLFVWLVDVDIVADKFLSYSITIHA